MKNEHQKSSNHSHPQPATSDSPFATSNVPPATNNPLPATSDSPFATSNVPLATSNLPPANNDIALSFQNVSKKFCRHLRRSMAYGIIDLSKNLIGMRPESTRLRKDEFWAIDNLNFELRKGEILGVIGPNGSGKSTLLRLLTGIFPPDKGEIMVKGRVGALIAVGAGFHPHMTGRENIYLNGAILGMNRMEIDSNFQDIVDFSEIGDFLDAPVSTYSSGMHVRLGFSIAVHINQEILLVDEVLAVGDVSFKIKTMNKMMEVIKSGTTIIFVSHDIMAVENICKRVLLLEHGRVEMLGNKDEVIGKYMMSQRRKAVENDGTAKSGFKESGLISFKYFNS